MVTCILDEESLVICLWTSPLPTLFHVGYTWVGGWLMISGEKSEVPDARLEGRFIRTELLIRKEIDTLSLQPPGSLSLLLINKITECCLLWGSHKLLLSTCSWSLTSPTWEALPLLPPTEIFGETTYLPWSQLIALSMCSNCHLSFFKTQTHCVGALYTDISVSLAPWSILYGIENTCL